MHIDGARRRKLQFEARNKCACKPSLELVTTVWGESPERKIESLNGREKLVICMRGGYFIFNHESENR